jgi:ABC-type transport system involved in cytochrome c biogenesis permease subunit
MMLKRWILIGLLFGMPILAQAYPQPVQPRTGEYQTATVPMQEGARTTFLIPIILIGLLTVVPFCFLWKKAGYSAWLGLLTFLPLGFLISLYVVAFIPWRTKQKQIERDSRQD